MVCCSVVFLCLYPLDSLNFLFFICQIYCRGPRDPDGRENLKILRTPKYLDEKPKNPAEKSRKPRKNSKIQEKLEKNQKMPKTGSKKGQHVTQILDPFLEAILTHFGASWECVAVGDAGWRGGRAGCAEAGGEEFEQNLRKGSSTPAPPW